MNLPHKCDASGCGCCWPISFRRAASRGRRARGPVCELPTGAGVVRGRRGLVDRGGVVLPRKCRPGESIERRRPAGLRSRCPSSARRTGRYRSPPILLSTFSSPATSRTRWVGWGTTKCWRSSAAAEWESCSRAFSASWGAMSRSRCWPRTWRQAARPASGSPAKPGPRPPSCIRTSCRFTRSARGRLPYLVMPLVACESLRAAIDAGAAGGQGDPAHRHAGRRRAGCRARAGAGAPRRQAGEHPAGKRRRRVLLTDFGLARAADDASLTRTGVVAGTPAVHVARAGARGGRSTPARTCSAWAACSTRWRPAGRRSAPRRRSASCGGSATRSRGRSARSTPTSRMARADRRRAARQVARATARQR